MITRIEIDGFKNFENFTLELQPFSAVVGPNASGKSNLFDALKFLSALASDDIRSAMQKLRGEPIELFRRTTSGLSEVMSFALEVFLASEGLDPFGTYFSIKSQRMRYEVKLGMVKDGRGRPSGIRLLHEKCVPLHKKDERHLFTKRRPISYSYRKQPFLDSAKEGLSTVVEIKQDGFTETGTSRRGRPVRLAASDSTRTALSVVSTAEFPHLYALKDFLSSINFLEINPHAARSPSDRFEDRTLRPDASNLAAVLAHLKDVTSSKDQPEGVLVDISNDLSSLIYSVSQVEVEDTADAKEYDFSVRMADKIKWSPRVISDGTLRILALLAILNDPRRYGVLCFEEPENGVHEGRVASLVTFLREATFSDVSSEPPFQILINTHSPAVLNSLEDDEVIVADTVKVIPKFGEPYHRTRMRTGVEGDVLEIDPDRIITRREIDRILKRKEGRI